MQIIHELQYDRLRLKGKDMTARLQSLNSAQSAFGTLMRQVGTDTQEVKLNAEEEKVVNRAIEGVKKLQPVLRRQMARVRVVDITAKKQAGEQKPAPSPTQDENEEEAAQGEEQAETKGKHGQAIETFNHQLI